MKVSDCLISAGISCKVFNFVGSCQKRTNGFPALAGHFTANNGDVMENFHRGVATVGEWQRVYQRGLIGNPVSFGELHEIYVKKEDVAEAEKLLVAES